MNTMLAYGTFAAGFLIRADGVKFTAELRSSARKLKPPPPDPFRHQDSTIAQFSSVLLNFERVSIGAIMRHTISAARTAGGCAVTVDPDLIEKELKLREPRRRRRRAARRGLPRHRSRSTFA